MHAENEAERVEWYPQQNQQGAVIWIGGNDRGREPSAAACTSAVAFNQAKVTAEKILELCRLVQPFMSYKGSILRVVLPFFLKELENTLSVSCSKQIC